MTNTNLNMKRRRFLQVVLGALGVTVMRPLPAFSNESPNSDFCFLLGNHWSYIGIGWQLGIESCALSVLDAPEIADRPPGLRTCINLDARAYELLAQEYPLLCARLKKYLAEDKLNSSLAHTPSLWPRCIPASPESGKL